MVVEALYVMETLFATTPFGRVDKKWMAFEIRWTG